jgi:uncharacterized protein YdaU (DUF1376 family)
MGDKPWFKFYPSDWLSGTRGMPAHEQGVYITLIASMYDKRSPLTEDLPSLARLCGSALRQFRNALDSLVTKGKIIRVPAGIWNERVEVECQKLNSKRELAQQAANARWNEKTQQKQPPSDADASKPQCGTDATRAGVRSQKLKDIKPAQHPEPRARPAESGCAAGDFIALGKRITDLMGVTEDPRWLGNWSTVQVWLSQGFDAELDVWPSVFSTVERLKKRGKAMPNSLKYFTNIIAENHAARQQSGVSPVQNAGVEFVSVRSRSPEGKAWLTHFRKAGRSTKFMETRDTFTVPSQWPPGHDPPASPASNPKDHPHA